MNWNQAEGNWKQFKGYVREKWGDLTDDDLDRIAGKREKLVGHIQEKYRDRPRGGGKASRRVGEDPQVTLHFKPWPSI